jgi:acetyl/propionyl-CoA carboxylase alpha subunit
LKLLLSAAGVKLETNVMRAADTIRVRFGDQDHAVRVVGSVGGLLVVEVEGRRLYITGTSIGQKRLLWVNGRTIRYERSATAVPRDSQDHGLVSAIPAVVLEVLVEPGDTVAAGSKLLLLESMKMVMPIVASGAGIVRAILCAPGDAVEPGVPLLEIDGLED